MSRRLLYDLRRIFWIFATFHIHNSIETHSVFYRCAAKRNTTCCISTTLNALRLCRPHLVGCLPLWEQKHIETCSDNDATARRDLIVHLREHGSVKAC